jgi:hypothetical protein
MQTPRWVRSVAFGLILFVPCQAGAAEFVFVGTRQVGMGGAGVAATFDATAGYWNPAALAMSKKGDIRLQGTGGAVDRGDFFDRVKEINQFNFADTSAANQARLQYLVNEINKPTTNLSGTASGGFYLKANFGEHAVGFNVSDIASSGGFVRTPASVTGTPGNQTVNGQFGLNGLEARQAAISYAYAFADRMFSIGITGKYIQGAAYTGTTNISGASDDIKIFEDLGRAKITSALSIDLGAMYRPASWLRFGVVAKDVTAPTFDAPNGEKFKLDPQVRAGMAVNPYSSLTLSADVDITSNKTLTPGVKSQILSLGAEQTILSELLSFRVGAYKNMQDSQTPFIPTAGFGLRLLALRIDIGGGYDFRDQAAIASGSLGMTF